MSVILFPVDRQTGDIERCARALHHKQGKAAERWWQTECNRLYGRLQVLGLSDAEIRSEVDRFARAVYREFERQHERHQHGTPGGAA